MRSSSSPLLLGLPALLFLASTGTLPAQSVLHSFSHGSAPSEAVVAPDKAAVSASLSPSAAHRPGNSAGRGEGRAELPFDPSLAPFYHGVASGDPVADGVVIWTRVTPDPDQTVSVDWEVATDTGFANVVQSGTTVTDTTTDYTVKVEVSGLSAASTYYYRFEALGAKSLVGRTRTAGGSSSHLRFVVVSCNNYQGGWFNSFGRIAERNDIDAVVHLGDFIYEYEPGAYGLGDSIGRGDLEPEKELIELADYRLRYNWYRLDPDLRRAMQQHPFIFVWDDHETANDSWTGGAENHDTLTEGDWEVRKNNGKKAWAEWAPVRVDPLSNPIYRTFDYGSLASLTMLDTRLEGRWKQADSIQDPSLSDPNRSMLGSDQFDWVVDELKGSPAQWKLLGNQVVFAPLLLEDFEAFYPGAQNAFLDVWNGYPAERARLMDSIAASALDDVVILTGDVHASFGFDVAPNPGDTLEYDPATGMGSVAVEFVTPSISSDNFDENIGLFLTNLFEDIFGDFNPHNAYIDLDRHGYYVLDLTAAKAQADYFADDIRNPSTIEAFDKGVYTNAGENHLQRTNTPAPGKAVQEIPAPDPTLATAIGEVPTGLMVMAAYPNPFTERIHLGFSLTDAESVTVRLLDMNGRVVAALYDGDLAPGTYRLDADVPVLPAGSYLLDVTAGDQHSGRMMVRR